MSQRRGSPLIRLGAALLGAFGVFGAVAMTLSDKPEPLLDRIGAFAFGLAFLTIAVLGYRPEETATDKLLFPLWYKLVFLPLGVAIGLGVIALAKTGSWLESLAFFGVGLVSMVIAVVSTALLRGLR